MRSNIIKNILNFLFVTVAVFSWSIKIVDAADFQSARTVALGGAGHASPMLSDAIYLNPSYVSLMQTHALSVNYLSFGNGVIPTDLGLMKYYGHNLNVSVMDGMPDSLFQAAVGYTRREDSAIFNIVASKGLFDSLGIGLGTKFILPSNAPGSRLTDATLSLTGILTDWVQVALIVDNVFETAKVLNLYREVILGTKVNVMGILNLVLDPHWTPTLPGDQAKWGYEAGVEFPFFSDFYLRVGAYKNAYVPYQSRRGDGYGVGFGWVGPKLTLDYAFSRNIGPLASDSQVFGFTIYF